jgi:hypothetical protein
LVQPRKIQEQKNIGADFPSAAAGDSSAAAGHQPITKDEYCNNTVDRKLQTKKN